MTLENRDFMTSMRLILIVLTHYNKGGCIFAWIMQYIRIVAWEITATLN